MKTVVINVALTVNIASDDEQECREIVSGASFSASMQTNYPVEITGQEVTGWAVESVS